MEARNRRENFLQNQNSPRPSSTISPRIPARPPTCLRRIPRRRRNSSPPSKKMSFAVEAPMAPSPPTTPRRSCFGNHQHPEKPLSPTQIKPMSIHIPPSTHVASPNRSVITMPMFIKALLVVGSCACFFVGCVRYTPTGNPTGQLPANVVQAPSEAGGARLAPPPQKGRSDREEPKNRTNIAPVVGASRSDMSRQAAEIHVSPSGNDANDGLSLIHI